MKNKPPINQKKESSFKWFFFFLIILPFLLLLFKSEHSFVTHDGGYHLERTYYYAYGLKQGDFLPSWARFYNNNSGSPIFVFLFPVPYWISSLLFLSGISLVASVKLGFIIFLLLGIIATYYFLKKGLSFSTNSSLIGSLIFAFSPYTLSQIFVRGSFRELAGISLIPLVLLMLSKIAQNPKKRNIGLLGLTLGIFLLTDGLIVYISAFLFLTFVYYFLSKTTNKTKFIYNLLLSSLIGLSISAFIFFPYVAESKFLNWNSAYFYKDHFVYFLQFFDPRWGFGFSLPGTNDGMSFQIGILNLLVILILFYELATKKVKLTPLIKICLLNLVIIFILMLNWPISHFIWEKIKPLQNIQLAWRLFAVSVIIFPILSTLISNRLKINNKILLVVYLLVLLLSFKYLRTNQIIVYEENSFTHNSKDSTAFHEFIPIWRENTTVKDFDQPVEIVGGTGTINNLHISNSSIKFNLESLTTTTTRINTLYFPGWTAYLNGTETGTTVTTNKTKNIEEVRDISGFIEITVPAGNNEVKLAFTDTQIRKYGKIISTVGLVIAIILLV